MTTILVVDDSGMDRKIAGGILEKESGWNIIFATEGQNAIEHIELHLPDIILTDLQMPKMDGLELVSRVHKNYPLIPVVLMTAKGSEEVAVKALRDGAANYVPKRLLAEELVDTVSRVLTSSNLDRSHSRLLHRMTRTKTNFTLENDLNLIPSVVHYLQQILTRMRVCGETDILRIGVALEETLLNAYYHGNLEISSELRLDDHRAYYDLARERVQQAPYRERQIYIDARLTPSESAYVIRDEGPGFNLSEIADATDPANLEKPCGRGLLLIHTFMDEVRYNESGNEVTMIKRHDRVETSDLEPEDE